jgi:predicted enzyme involved in methoxymalonyl-ACP biosynthesis
MHLRLDEYQAEKTLGYIRAKRALKGKNGRSQLILNIIAKKKRFHDIWIMRSRVPKRETESLIVNQMACQVQKRGIRRLVGEYLSASKCKIVKSSCFRLGFTPSNGEWGLVLVQFKGPRTVFHRK